MTRTIARGTDVAGETIWRVSLAQLRGAARFSQFTGFDRTFLLLDDDIVQLHSQDGLLVAQRGQPQHFSGDLHIWIEQLTRSTNALNVMARRDTCRASVNVITDSARITPASTQFLIALSSAWWVGGLLSHEMLLDPMKGLWLEGTSACIDVKPLGPCAHLASIAFEPRLP